MKPIPYQKKLNPETKIAVIQGRPIKLSLSGNNLDDDTLKEFFSILNQHPDKVRIRQLNLAYNALNGESARGCAQLLKVSNSSTEEIDLTGNKLGNSGANILLTGVRENPNTALKILSLANNGLVTTDHNEPWMQSLQNILKTGQLVELDLSDNVLVQKAHPQRGTIIRNLANICMQSTTLRTINFNHCGLEVADIHELLIGLQQGLKTKESHPNKILPTQAIEVFLEDNVADFSVDGGHRNTFIDLCRFAMTHPDGIKLRFSISSMNLAEPDRVLWNAVQNPALLRENDLLKHAMILMDFNVNNFQKETNAVRSEICKLLMTINILDPESNRLLAFLRPYFNISISVTDNLSREIMKIRLNELIPILDKMKEDPRVAGVIGLVNDWLEKQAAWQASLDALEALKPVRITSEPRLTDKNETISGKSLPQSIDFKSNLTS